MFRLACVAARGLQLVLKSQLCKLRARNTERLGITYPLDAFLQRRVCRDEIPLLYIFDLKGGYFLRKCLKIDFGNA